VQHYFAALDEKRFLSSDIVQDLPVVTDMHVPTLARILTVMCCGCCSWTCANLCKFFVFYSLCI